MAKVFVTGGSGFIGGHAILRLLGDGHEVTATLRSLSKADQVRAVLADFGAPDLTRLAFVAADLSADAGWAEAVAGCDYGLHLASPFPATIPKHEDELIIPARDGALRVLKAARQAGVKRVVLTSSFAAVGYGHPEQRAPFDETSWTVLNGPDTGAYAKSKTIAERAAWDYVATEGKGLELAVVNPVGVFGPVLGADYATSILIVQRLMDGDFPGCPDIIFGVVDVRDVVDLHVRAMTAPEAAGERFLATAGDFLSFQEIAKLLKDRLGPAAGRVPTRKLPNWMVRLVSVFDPAARQIIPELGKYKNATSAKARERLGWTPRSSADALVATAQSLIALKLLKPA